MVWIILILLAQAWIVILAVAVLRRIEELEKNVAKLQWSVDRLKRGSSVVD